MCKSIMSVFLTLFFFNDTATTEIYTLSLHDALPICSDRGRENPPAAQPGPPRACAVSLQQVPGCRGQNSGRASLYQFNRPSEGQLLAHCPASLHRITRKQWIMNAGQVSIESMRWRPK